MPLGSITVEAGGTIIFCRAAGLRARSHPSSARYDRYWNIISIDYAYIIKICAIVAENRTELVTNRGRLGQGDLNNGSRIVIDGTRNSAAAQIAVPVVFGGVHAGPSVALIVIEPGTKNELPR